MLNCNSYMERQDAECLKQLHRSIQSLRKVQTQSSCDACKFRRVRCRRDSESVPCSKCAVQGIKCITTGDRRKMRGKGAHIDHAIVLHTAAGRHVKENAVDTRTSSATARLRSTVHLSDKSIESALALSEFVGQLSSHLIELHFTVQKLPLPLHDWVDFRQMFEDAGRKPEQMSPMLEALAATLIAYGSRASDAPAIVGLNAPTVSTVDKADGDLSYYGRRRSAICDALADRAIRLADEKGAFRLKSKESIIVLLLLEILLDHGDSMYRGGQPYRIAMQGHARSMSEDVSGQLQLSELRETSLGWVILLRDTTQAACSGRTPGLRDDDVDLLCKRQTGILLTNDGHHGGVSNSQIDVWDGVWIYIIKLMRNFATRLATITRSVTIPPRSADGLTLDEVIWAAYSELDEGKRYISSIRTVFTPPSPSDGSADAQNEPFWLTLGSHSMQLQCILVVFVAHRAIGRELERLDKASQVMFQVESDVEECKLRLLAVQRNSNERMKNAAREFACLLWAKQNSLASRAALGIMPGIHVLPNECFHIFAEVLCALQTREEGALADYSLETKIQEVGWLLSSFRLLSWAWPNLGETVAYVERQYVALKDLRDRIVAQGAVPVDATDVLFDANLLEVEQFESEDSDINENENTATTTTASSFEGFVDAPCPPISVGVAWSNMDDTSLYGTRSSLDDTALYFPFLDQSVASLDWVTPIHQQLLPAMDFRVEPLDKALLHVSQMGSEDELFEFRA